MLALTSATSGGHSVGIVRSRTKATEFVFYVCIQTGNVPSLDITAVAVASLFNELTRLRVGRGTTATEEYSESSELFRSVELELRSGSVRKLPAITKRICMQNETALEQKTNKRIVPPCCLVSRRSCLNRHEQSNSDRRVIGRIVLWRLQFCRGSEGVCVETVSSAALLSSASFGLCQPGRSAV
jgi:hypothetical protein